MNSPNLFNEKRFLYCVAALNFLALTNTATGAGPAFKNNYLFTNELTCKNACGGNIFPASRQNFPCLLFFNNYPNATKIILNTDFIKEFCQRTDTSAQLALSAIQEAILQKQIPNARIAPSQLPALLSNIKALIQAEQELRDKSNNQAWFQKIDLKEWIKTGGLLGVIGILSCMVYQRGVALKHAQTVAK